MNEQTIATQNQTPGSKLGPVKPYLDKAGQILKPFWERFKQTRFYTNKKIFYTLTGLFGLMFLIIFLGILFGNRGGSTLPQGKPSPTPIIGQVVSTPTPSGDILSQIGQKLFDIKTQMDALDVKQSRLQPPALDFKITF